MASYSQFIGRHITVQYRTAGLLLPASGTLVADSGRSIFLEQHMHIRGKLSYFRWEIPYQYIHHIHRLQESAAPASESAPRTVPQVVGDPADDTEYPIPPLARAASASGSTVILSFPDPRKT